MVIFKKKTDANISSTYYQKLLARGMRSVKFFDLKKLESLNY